MSTKNVVVITNCPDLTSAVYRGLKQYSKQTKPKILPLITFKQVAMLYRPSFHTLAITSVTLHVMMIIRRELESKEGRALARFCPPPSEAKR